MLDLFNDCLVSLPFPGVDKTSDIFTAPSLLVNVAIFVAYVLIQRTFFFKFSIFNTNLTKLGQKLLSILCNFHVHTRDGCNSDDLETGCCNRSDFKANSLRFDRVKLQKMNRIGRIYVGITLPNPGNALCRFAGFSNKTQDFNRVLRNGHLSR